MTNKTPGKGYAIAHLTKVDFGPEIIEYLERIDATLAPYDGRFIVHGGDIESAEGEWGGDMIIIEFPSTDAARAWYASPAYQEILPLRTEHSTGPAALLTGVSVGHQATDKLAELLSS